MFTEAQNLYMTEVLGLNPNHMVAASASQPAETIVMTGPLSAAESALLKKILASVHLENYTHIDSHQEVAAANVLVFGGALHQGRHQLGHSVWWSLPSLTSMLGADHSVIENKKQTWNLLQQMLKERA